MNPIRRTAVASGPQPVMASTSPIGGPRAAEIDPTCPPVDGSKRKRSAERSPTGQAPAGAAALGPFGGAAAPATMPEPKRRRGERAGDPSAAGSKILWPAVAYLFEDDGTLGDVEVLGTTRNDWRNVLLALEQSDCPLQLFLDTEPVASFVHDFDALFEADDQREWRYMLAVDLDGNKLHAHFFEETTIAFDFDWYDVFDQEGLDAMLDFLRLLHRATNKRSQIAGGLFVCDGPTGGQVRGPLFCSGVRPLTTDP
jgi:hypothetical protein